MNQSSISHGSFLIFLAMKRSTTATTDVTMNRTLMVTMRGP